MSHLVGEYFPAQKRPSSRAAKRSATLNMPAETATCTRARFVDLMMVFLAGRAAEQIVFGRITNGAANDLERVTQIARSMVFSSTACRRSRPRARARRQLRALGGDEAATATRAGAAHRLRVRGGAAAADEAPRVNSDRVAGALLERGGSTAANRGAARGREAGSRSSRPWAPFALPLRD